MVRTSVRSGNRHRARLRIVNAVLAPESKCAPLMRFWNALRDRALCLTGPELCSVSEMRTGTKARPLVACSDDVRMCCRAIGVRVWYAAAASCAAWCRGRRARRTARRARLDAMRHNAVTRTPHKASRAGAASCTAHTRCAPAAGH